MRKEPTDAEKKLWSLLRRGKLNGYHFRRQVPVAGYIIDFCCLSAGLGVEADGGQHYDDEGREYDERRSRALREKGIRIIRFSDVDILKFPDAVQEMIYRELTEKPPPTLSPRSTGGGERWNPRSNDGVSCDKRRNWRGGRWTARLRGKFDNQSIYSATLGACQVKLRVIGHKASTPSLTLPRSTGGGERGEAAAFQRAREQRLK